MHNETMHDYIRSYATMLRKQLLRFKKEAFWGKKEPEKRTVRNRFVC